MENSIIYIPGKGLSSSFNFGIVPIRTFGTTRPSFEEADSDEENQRPDQRAFEVWLERRGLVQAQ